MKILYVTTVGGTMRFFEPLINELIHDGHQVDVATNENAGNSSVPSFYRNNGCNVITIPWSRSPFKVSNIDAIRVIGRIVRNNNYDIVHCHTPIASACTRIACRKMRKNGLTVIYTAHGFHFYSGAPLKNWLLYYPVEKICSRWTDYLITINKEDFQRANNKFHNPEILYVPGVGIDTNRYASLQNERSIVRKELCIRNSDILVVSVGELNENKNQSVIIRALAKCKSTSIHYALAGKGHMEASLKELSRLLGVENQVHILGYRNDIPALYGAADICAFPSIREGQGIAAIEGMAAGLPLVASDNRGMRGILVDKENAIICKHDDVDAFAEAIMSLADDYELRKTMGEKNKELSKQFDISIVNKQMKEIYKRVAR